MVAAFVGVAVHLSPVAHPEPAVVHHLLLNLPFVLAAVIAWRVSTGIRSGTPAWRVLSAAMVCSTAGNVSAGTTLGSPGVSSTAGVLWLAFHALLALALVWLARGWIAAVTTPLLLDAAIAGMVAAALAASAHGDHLLDSGRVAPAAVIELVNPIADLVLVWLLAATMTLVVRVRRSGVGLALGLLLLLAVDVGLLTRSDGGTWAAGIPLGLFWASAATLVGLSALSSRPTEWVAPVPRLVVPGLGVLVSLTVLVWGQVGHPGPVPVVLALAGVSLAAVRVSIALRELRSRAEALLDRPDRLARLTDLRHAFRDDQIVAHFQPQVDLRSGRVVGVEVLARWQHPTRGLLCPKEFLPLLEEDDDLMVRLTRLMLERAAQAGDVLARLGHPIGLSVNLSTPELAGPSLVGSVADLLRRAPTGLQALTLEITEEKMISDPDGARVVLQALRSLGVRVSLDDYGTGYASLAYLRDLPLDEVKLDRSFVDGALGDARTAAIAASTVELAHHLDLSIVAEGIEDSCTSDWLTSIGCDIGQGYYYARPMPLPDLVAWLDARPVRPADPRPPGAGD